MQSLANFLNSLPHSELMRLKQLMQTGELLKEVNERMREEEKKHGRACSTCSNELDAYNVNNYTILFGPDDFKKRASFCGMDCLQYFLEQIKNIRTEEKKPSCPKCHSLNIAASIKTMKCMNCMHEW